MQSGGGLYLSDSDFCFIECIFQNNTGSGYSNIRGGAIFSLNSILYLHKNNLIDNNLNQIDVLNPYSNIKGAACYFDNSESRISNCNFVNNTIHILDSKIYSSHQICGGGIYSYTTTKSFSCINCYFINNTVYIPNKKEKEYGGAIYLSNGTLNNCTFIDNEAYNGCNIKYKQIKNSQLFITNCIFKQNKIENKNEIKSLIYFDMIYNSSVANEFSNNKIFNNILSYLFDGITILKSIVVEFNFKDNCLSPHNSNNYTSSRFMIYNENGEEFSFNSALNSGCNEDVISNILAF